MFKRDQLVFFLIIALVIIYLTTKSYDKFGNYFNDKSKCKEKFENTSNNDIQFVNVENKMNTNVVSDPNSINVTGNCVCSPNKN